MSIGKRLAEQRKLAGYNKQKELAADLGVNLTTISRWEQEQAPIPSDKLSRMNELGLDAVYILTGQKTATVAGFENKKHNNGNKLEEYATKKTGNVAGFESDDIFAEQAGDGSWRVHRGGKTVHGTVDDVIRYLQEEAAPYIVKTGTHSFIPNVEDYDWIPLYDAEVSAGGGRFFDGENILTYLAFTKYSLRKQGLQPDMLACVRVSGDSMEPTIQSNDAVMIDMRQTTADSGIFVFRVGEVLYLKRLVREGAGVRVISDNDIYPSWLIQPGEDFQIVGKRVWHARWGE